MSGPIPAMRDLKDPRWMWVKAVLLALIATVCLGLLWMQAGGGWQPPLLLALLVWSACRVHYFFFHVLERWVEPGGRFRGLSELMGLAFRKGRRR